MAQCFSRVVQKHSKVCCAARLVSAKPRDLHNQERAIQEMAVMIV
jgi:hypothetical protein